MELETNKDLGSGGSGSRTWEVAASCCLILAGLGGAALLVWWAFAFHPSNQHLWMVPVGLILLGTPIIAWLSICAVDLCRRFELMTTPPALDPER